MMKFTKNVLFLFLLPSVIYSQTNIISPDIAREINEQIFDTDNFYPKSSIQTNKRFDPLNGKVKREIISYSDSTQIINNYNINGNLILSKVLKKGILKGTYSYEYKLDGKTLLKERGVNNLDYMVYKKDKYSTKYYAVSTTNKKQGLFYKYLDTLFINETKYSYEFIKQSNSKYNPVYEYKYKFKYNNLGYLKQIDIFENDIKVGHSINNYDKNNQVINQELFWVYKWFVEDTGFPSVRNRISEIKYHNRLIKSITNKSYNPVKHVWEKQTTNYKSVITKSNNNIVKASFSSDSGENIIIEIDRFNNWVRKTDDTITTTRVLKYYK